MSAQSTTLSAKEKTRRDDRRFYRIALAVVAPLPMLFEGTKYLINPVPADGTVADGVAALANGGTGALRAVLLLDTPFFAFLIPAVIAVALVTRRTAPRLTAWGMALTVPGFALGFSTGASGDRLSYFAATKGLDVGTLTAYSDASFGLPEVAISSLLFIIGIVFGLLLLGIALARSGAVPAVFGVALAVGGFTHPFLGAVLSHVVVGFGLWVAAIGFLGASIALWRTTNDELALAPR